MARLLIMAIALALPAPAVAQNRGAVSLAADEAVVLRLDAGGNPVVVSPPGSAEWTPYEVAVARHLSGQPIPDAPVPFASPAPSDGVPEPDAVRPDALHLRFFSIAGHHAMLVVENGYDRAVVYRARIRLNDTDRQTDVCLVPHNRRGFEHWPDPIERIEISGFRFVDWQDGQAVPCA